MAQMNITVGFVAMNTNRKTVRKSLYMAAFRTRQVAQAAVQLEEYREAPRPHRLTPYRKLVQLHIDGTESKARMPRAKGLELAKRQALQRQKDRVYRMLHPVKAEYSQVAGR